MGRYHHAAVDDATRVRALKIYKRHPQKSDIDFIDYFVEKFPFRIQTIRTDRGHEFQALPAGTLQTKAWNTSTSKRERPS